MPRTISEAQRTEALRLYHDELLTAAEAGQRAGVSERQVRRWLGGSTRRPGPLPPGAFPEAYWRGALKNPCKSGDVTAVCPEHEPGGRLLAHHATPGEARAACGRHYQASGHRRPWVMDAERWDWLMEFWAGAGTGG